MGTVYILKNQYNFYLDKSGEWVNGENSKSLFRTAHKDEAINQKVEFSVKNFELRIEVAEVEAGERGSLHVEVLAEAPEVDSEADDSLTGEESISLHEKESDQTTESADTSSETAAGETLDLIVDTHNEPTSPPESQCLN